jgi:serine/threonine protein kinase
MLNIGATLDNYEILDLLGSGGFGRVWRAKDLTVKGRQVAIKELTDPTPERMEGFLREMEILASLKHPGIVTFHHALNEGRYLVMEYIPEGSLRRRFGVGTLMGADKAIAIMSSLCDVLVAVHERRVVHRDLKPDNIFLQGKTVRVGDFGIAEIIQTGKDVLQSGTLPYMAPELFKKDLGLADHRSDIYAVGIVLTELLTGARPFEASDAGQLIYKICFESPSIPRDIPPWLQGILQKSLAKSPDLRFQSAQELKQALDSKIVPQLYPAALIKANRTNVTAESLLGRGKITSALSHVEQGLQHYPDHPRLMFTKARCLLILRRPKEAQALLLRSRQLDPGIQCEKELGYAHIETQEYGKAISCLTEYTRRRPDDLKSFALLMEAMYMSGSYEQTAEIGAALRREDPLFLNNGLLAATLAGDLEKGLELFVYGTKHMEWVPDYIRYNMAVLGKFPEIGTTRIKNVLFFASFPNTIMPGKVLRPKVKPLRVEVQTPGKHVKAHVFEDGFVSVGRSPNLDITIVDDHKVSRFHGLFYYRDALYHYRDLKSTLGSFAGEMRVHGDIPLMGMEAISIGSSLLKVSY